jgi:hypothetical protein
VAVCGGREGGQLGRTAERRGVLGEGQQEGGEALGELRGDAWSGAGAGGSLGRRSTATCGAAAAWQRRKKKGGGAPGAKLLNLKIPGPYYK